MGAVLEKLSRLLHEKVGTSPILGWTFLLVVSHARCSYSGGTITISLDEVTPCVRESCWSCFDMTAEFADISVGSARLPKAGKRQDTGIKSLSGHVKGRAACPGKEEEVLEFRTFRRVISIA